jgi:hypothetical protein
LKTIHKFPLHASDLTVLDLPVGAQVLHAGAQRGTPCVWVLLDTDEPDIRPRRIGMFGTGHPASKHATAGNYVDTVFLHGGDLVFHIFDLDKEQS